MNMNLKILFIEIRYTIAHEITIKISKKQLHTNNQNLKKSQKNYEPMREL